MDTALDRVQEMELVAGSRRYWRAGVEGITVNIADEHIVMAGVVENVSRGGLRVSALPAKFKFGKPYYKGVVSLNGESFKVIVQPCWSRQKEDASGELLEMGFRIIDAPWEWTKFVMGMVHSKLVH